MTDRGARSWLSTEQRPVAAETVLRAAGALKRYRVMAFVTGVVLLTGTVLLILKVSGVGHLEPGTGFVWLAHGYLYLVYVIVTGMLGFKLRWPLARYALVMLAGTIPTMSFVAERYVTRATRGASVEDAAAPVPARD